MLTLYYATNTCALASHIALEEAGAAFETRWVDFGAAEQTKPEYLKINPKGRVPALVTEHGVLTETPAILAYIAQRHPEAGVAPLDDPFAFAELQAFMSYLCATVHVAHAHRARGYRWADDPAAFEAMKKKVPQSVGVAAGPVGHGRRLYDRRPLSLHPRPLDGGRRRRPQRLPAGARPPRPDGRAPRRPAGAQ
jgi:glutathione S-transferase